MRPIFFVLLLMLVAGIAFTLGRMTRQDPPLAAEPAKPYAKALEQLNDLRAAATELAPPAWEQTKRAAADEAVKVGAPLLERWIVSARQAAVDDGVEPMAADIRRQFVGFYPAAVLDRVRWRIGWSEGQTLYTGIFRIRNTKALTLGDVIVFRDAEVARDPRLWAHELTHVVQYERWGTSGFAEHYVRDLKAVEDEAWEATGRYEDWARDRRWQFSVEGDRPVTR